MKKNRIKQTAPKLSVICESNKIFNKCLLSNYWEIKIKFGCTFCHLFFSQISLVHIFIVVYLSPCAKTIIRYAIETLLLATWHSGKKGTESFLMGLASFCVPHTTQNPPPPETSLFGAGPRILNASRRGLCVCVTRVNDPVRGYLAPTGELKRKQNIWRTRCFFFGTTFLGKLTD